MTIAASAKNAGAAGEPVRDGSRQSARNSLLLAASLFATALLAAMQAVALLVICGTDPRTEAFLSAYALYLPVAVLGASLRTTVSALVARASTSERAVHAGEVVSRCILCGAAATTTMLVLSPLLAPAISRGLPADVRDVTQVALLLLLPGAFLHFVAAALAGALGAHHQFRFSARMYVASGALSLVVTVGMLSAIGPLGAAIGVLAGTVMLAAAHLRRARALGICVRFRLRALLERAQWDVTMEILSGAVLGFALQANLAISLAALSGQPGAITAYSYAFFMTTMVLSLSSLPLALVTLPNLVDAVRERGRMAVADHLARFAPYAYAVVLPLVAGFIGFGRAAVDVAVAPFVDAAVAQLLFDVGWVLVLMTLPATLFYLASAASLPVATPRERLLAGGLTVGLHGAAVALAWGGDPQAVAWAHAAAMLLSTIALLAQVLRRHAPSALLRALRGIAPVLVAAALILLIGLSVGSGAATVMILASACAASVIYVLALRQLAPAVLEPFAAVLRRVATP